MKSPVVTSAVLGALIFSGATDLMNFGVQSRFSTATLDVGIIVAGAIELYRLRRNECRRSYDVVDETRDR
jgi:hypothetical protein